VSLIIANLAVVVTYIHRLFSKGEDIDHSLYSGSGAQIRSGALKGIVKHASMKPNVSPMHFPLSPQSRSDQRKNSTLTDVEKSVPSEPFDPLSFSADLRDDEDPDKKTFGSVVTWRGQEEETGVPLSPTRVIVTRETIVASEYEPEF